MMQGVAKAAAVVSKVVGVGRQDDGRRARWVISKARLGVMAGMLAGIGFGGCAHDCDQSYCDMVRAGASGWFAHELQCCRDPDAAGCDAREARLHEFNLLAARMRAACEARNWDLFRDLWNDGWRILPGFMPFLIADEFCDGWDWTGLNAWVPFDSDDSIAASIGLDPGVPRLRLGRVGTSSPPDAEIATPVVEHEWTIRSGSMVSVEAFGVGTGFAARGSLSLLERLEEPGIQPDDDAESWCRRMEPRAFTLDLEASGGRVSLRLDPDFEGSQMRFDRTDGGVLGIGVSIEALMDSSGGPPFQCSIDSAFLEIPFVIESDRTLTFLPGVAISMLDLFPVDPIVEAWIRGADPRGAGFGEDGCIDQARAVAEAYMALHPDCVAGSNRRAR